MKVKDLIAMLEELPQEADIYFSVGSDDSDRLLHAKAEIMEGCATSDMRLKEVKFNQWYTKESRPDGEGLVQFVLWENNYDSWRDFHNLADQFDKLTKYIKWEWDN